ncbi:hypothetical protein AAFF_G00223100 [Aldrovandia affinis]|uniref:SCA7 domain-containing protein n=1 Tax=Aldrovandia affinis TaxID=143900 RepID=A0AAD7RFI0_9TELE|nr:hypothetical protein AAFF_G00223100 [Aldrovandia affinis]
MARLSRFDFNSPSTERRHGPASKPPSASMTSSAYPMPKLSSRGKGSGEGDRTVGHSASGNSTSSNSKLLKPKEKLPIHKRAQIPFKVLQNKILTPAVSMEKTPLRVFASAKLVHVPSSSTTVSLPMKPSLNSPSISKAPLLAPGQIPNGKSLPSLDKNQDNNASTKRQLHKRPSGEWPQPSNGWTHSLSQRRAVLGRRKRFDTLLADHKSKAGDKELLRGSEYTQQTPPLRDPHFSPSQIVQDHHQVSHGNSTAADAKPSVPSKPKPQNLGLPR